MARGVILLGRTGVGKSTLANNLVGRNVFPTGASMSPVTRVDSDLVATSECGRWTVCDSVGLRDPGVTKEQVANSLRATVERVPSLSVLLFLFQFGRITDTELEDFLVLVNEMFGVDCLKNMYVVFTKCDNNTFITDRAARSRYLADHATSSSVFRQIWDMLGQNADRFVFIDNPEQASTSNAALRAEYAELAAAARTTVGAVIDGWQSTPYTYATMQAVYAAEQQKIAAQRAEEQRARDAEADGIRLKAEQDRENERRRQELEQLQRDQEAEKQRAQAAHDAEVARIRAQHHHHTHHSHCFAAATRVLLADGSRVAASELCVGDHVQAVDEAGNVVFSPVYYSSHHVGSDRVVTITAAGSGSREYCVTTTGEHLIYAARAEAAQIKQPVTASSVEVGDFVWLVEEGATAATQGRVVKVVEETRSEEFQNVLVLANCMIAGDAGGVLASSYCINHRWQVWDSLDLRLLYHVYPSALSSTFVRKYVEAYDDAVESAVPKLRDTVRGIVDRARAWLGRSNFGRWR